MSETVHLQLSPEHALVLLDWLARFNQRDDRPLDDPAEGQALDDLEAMLEKRVEAVLAPDYRQQVESARAALRPADD